MGYPPTRPKIMEYFTNHVGEHVFIGDIAKSTKLTEGQVRGAINNLRSSHNYNEIDFPIEVVQRGQIWCYRPNRSKPTATASTKAVYEELGVTKAGEVIIQDETGKLYKATEL